MPATKMLITVPAMIWSIFQLTAHKARNTPSSAPEATPAKTPVQMLPVAAAV